MMTMLWMKGLAYPHMWKLSISSQHRLDVRGAKGMMQHPSMQSCLPQLLPPVLTQTCLQHLGSCLLQVLPPAPAASGSKCLVDYKRSTSHLYAALWQISSVPLSNETRLRRATMRLARLLSRLG